SCTVTNIPQKTFYPNQPNQIELQYLAPDVEGTQERSLSVVFFEELAPKLRITVKARILNKLSTIPKEIAFRNFDQVHSQQMSLVLINNTQEVLMLPKLISSEPWLSAKIHESYVGNHYGLGSQQCWRIDVSVNGQTRFAQHQQAADLVIVAHPKDDILESKENKLTNKIRVRLSVSPSVKVVPSMLFIGEMAHDSEKKASILVSFLRDVKPKFKSIHYPSFLAHSKHQVALLSPNQFRVDLTLIPSDPTIHSIQQAELLLRFEMADASVQSIRLPLHVKMIQD
ncbi:hypothetical protein SAMN05444166_8282, partial [Singulisphaera sp. GP187]|uniref:hypothetical protein n=1 Tax=Singulisphaera sp. GP187 TaxID=1882752 RepID=UPI000928C3DA